MGVASGGEEAVFVNVGIVGADVDAEGRGVVRGGEGGDAPRGGGGTEPFARVLAAC